MKKTLKPLLIHIYHTAENILYRILALGLSLLANLSFLCSFFTGPWYTTLVCGIVACVLTIAAWTSLDFRPEYQVQDTGIWFRDYKAVIPYSYMDRGEYCTVPGMRSTDYEVDIFLSPAIFLDGQICSEKLRKKLKRENKIRVLLSEEEKDKYDSLCSILQSRIPMRDASDDPFPE